MFFSFFIIFVFVDELFQEMNLNFGLFLSCSLFAKNMRANIDF